MELLSFLPSVPVGVVRFRDPRPLVTVVLKVTYRLALGRDAELAPVQEPLGLDHGAGGELRSATDFVPRKGAVDVLVVGDASASAPATSIQVRIAGHGLDKRAVVTSPTPENRVPLTRAALGGVALGPGAWAEARFRLSDGPFLSPDGPPLAPLRSGFDYSFFNAAPPDQRLGAWPAQAAFYLEGLMPGGASGYVRFPAAEPALYVVEGERVTSRAALRCDTLWLDAARALAVLTFRAEFPDVEGAAPRLLVGMATRDSGPSAAELSARLRDAERVRAIEASALAPRAAVAGSRAGALPAGQATVVAPSSVASAVLPFQQGDFVPPSSRAMAAQKEGLPGAPPLAATVAFGSGTVAVLSGSKPPASKPTPFGPAMSVTRSGAASSGSSGASASASATASAGEASLPAATAVETVALTGGGAVRAAPLPFAAFGPALGVVKGAASSGVAAAVPVVRVDTGTVAVLPGRGGPAPTPFGPKLAIAPAAPPGAVESVASAFPAPSVGDALPAWREAPAPPPAALALAVAAPVSEPRALTTLEWALVLADLWAEPRARARVLAQHGLDERAFHANEARIQAELAADARAGEHERILELGRALEDARRAQSDASEAKLALDDYVRLRAVLEIAPEPARVLADNDSSAPDWERIDREHKAHAAADPERARELATRLKAVRRELVLRRGRSAS